MAFGCNTPTPESIDINSKYKKEMYFKINGLKYQGVASVKMTDRYEIELEIRQKPDLLKISTCHREITIEKPGKTFYYEYFPVKRETKVPCLMEIVALDKSGEHSWSLIDFVAKDELLKAKIGCNGSEYQAVGSTVCQAKAGLIQTISFDKPVRASYSDRCPQLNHKFEKDFEYLVFEGVCQYLFYDGKDFFRLMTFGYTKILIL